MTPYRLAAGFLLVTLLLSQAGLSLLHTHQGRPDDHPVAVHSASETASCTVCALDGIMTPDLPTVHAIFLVVSGEVSLPLIAEGVERPAPGFSLGRAPPVC